MLTITVQYNMDNLFEEGVGAALKNWDLLTTAVDEQWGGAESEEKADWIHGVIIDMFKGKKEGAGARLGMSWTRLLIDFTNSLRGRSCICSRGYHVP